MRLVQPESGEPERSLSSVELYRRGLPARHSYDLFDPMDRAIYRALQAYVAYEETTLLEDSLNSTGAVLPPWRSPAVFEDTARDLASWKRGLHRISSRDRLWRQGVFLLRAMFSPAAAGPGDGFTVVPGFFQAGKGYVPPLGALGPIGQETPLETFWEGLAPLSALVQDALGPLLTQSEAARELGLTPAGVARRIDRKELRRLRIGRQVLIPARDVRAPRSGPRKRGGSGVSPVDTKIAGLGPDELRNLIERSQAELRRRGADDER